MRHTSPFARLLIAEANLLGLQDIRIEERKRHAALCATTSDGRAVIQLFSRGSHALQNWRRQKKAVSDLRRTARQDGGRP